MCNQCGDANTTHEDHALPELGRRKLLTMAGAGLAAAPLLGALPSGDARAQSSTASASTLGKSPFQVQAYGAKSTGGRIEPLQIQRRALGPNDVLIDVLYAGVCHSDIHTVRGDWGAPSLPVVPGHEIVGRVLAAGNKVTKFKVGEIAGVGCMVDACGTCANCLADREQICLNGTTFTYNSPDKVSGGQTFGGYSDKLVVTERFAIRIPPGMDLASTPPILCAGITTFSPIRHWQVRPGQRVAVVGMGGLGHMAVKLAVAQSAEVTVFTTTPGKVEDAKRFGAREAVLWSDTAAFKRLANSFDWMISTVPYPFEVQPFLDVLKLDSTFVNVGLGQPQGINTTSMAFGRKSLAGSMIGGIAETQEVVDHCFARNIRPDIELIRPDQISAVYERVVNKEARYRFVIDFSSTKRAA
ncbi:NAD(P)-dependent alcohol dehydrogenase [Burkholderia multivorans]|uniref:Enoyl reductase (ER) domain-containing protein n=1 Tax=Burkholderia multivorans CGD2 TaxID=513052 RepID=B9BUF1_9BURK|nr:NAD(P)-dependent alcohol dehydrogenase [Burkholderia multivorans]EEE05448.1 conserved hypothetical protein [Burkholderia multivorans CGD2]EEE11720.1 conserved hypothetical protein [Burkholderia multivorans CGD2M]